jgi:cyanophycin synthetase
MHLLHARRLTGPNLLLPRPAAIAEVAFAADEDPAPAIAAWRARVTAALVALGWLQELAVRRTVDAAGRPGAELVFAAPIDALYLAADIAEWAASASGDPADTPAAQFTRWRAEATRVRDPRFVALQRAAAARDLPLLIGEDLVTVGHGCRAMTWPEGQLPDPADVPWDRLGRVPLALITGTNGKTTTARLLARIARRAGLVAGNTSTDGMAVDERTIEEGDWTGPGAARAVLRRPEVELAALEVARGGILRRGLAVDRCDAAVITNIAADHLGEHGVHDLATMARVKAVALSVVAPHGRVILGADSPPLGALVDDGHRFPAPLVWFARAAAHPRIAAHRAAGGEAWFVEDGLLTRARGPHVTRVLNIADSPLCFGGAAVHNVENTLAAAALAHALGLPDDAIARGLASFSSSYADNPGRANVTRVGDVVVFLDFAHNPAGVRGLRGLLAALRGRHRLLVSFGVAGDRRDDDIRDLARAVHELSPDEIRIRDLERYRRGRALGEVPALLHAALRDLGTPDAAIRENDTELEILREGLAWARPGDVVAILDHVERDEIQAALRRLTASPAA